MSNQVTVSSDRIIQICIACVIAFFAFRSDIFSAQSSTDITIAKLSTEVGNLSRAVEKFEKFTERPILTVEEFDLRNIPFKEKISQNGLEIKILGEKMDNLELLIRESEIKKQILNSELTNLDEKIDRVAQSIEDN